jgi:hypothetical protein
VQTGAQGIHAGAGDAEDGDEFARAGDLDLVDEGLDGARAVDGDAGLGQFGIDGRELLAVVGVARAGGFVGGGQGLGEQAVGVAVEGDEGGQDGGVDVVGGQAGGGAPGAAVAAAAEAGEVAVDLGTALGGGADELVAALGAGDQTGELVVAGGVGVAGVRVALAGARDA